MQKKNPAKRRPERLVVTLLSLLFLSTAVFATVKYVFRAPELDTDKPVVTPDGTASTDADRADTDEPTLRAAHAANTATTFSSPGLTTTTAAATRTSSSASTCRTSASTL